MTGTVEVRAPASNACRPGDTIEVTFAWALDQPPATIEARLFWFTQGKGTQDVTIVETQPVSPVQRGEQRVRFRLPQGPYSFSGTLISLLWAVELVAEDVAGRWELVLAPDGAEIQLSAVAAPRTMPFSISYARSR